MNKTAVKKFAIWARRHLIDNVTQVAFAYGITADNRDNASQQSVCIRSVTAAEQEQRSQLLARIRTAGFAQTMEEAAYTWFNRFIALRFMEVNRYLPSHTRLFSDESGAFKPEVLSDAVHLEMEGLDRSRMIELLEKQENEQLYKYLLITQCNALHDVLPEMFEQISGWTELLFPQNLLRADSLIARMIADIPEEDWRDQVQIIGWLYQYYNTEPKDQVFADLKKNIKITAETVPAATQLFTPDWIVRYMTENSLGRLWAEGHGKPAGADWKYYLEEAEQEELVRAELAKRRGERRHLQPEQIRFLDPCMGSGHILVYAFDVLMQIYVSCGWSERDAAVSILRHNLYGLDIDRRVYQLAYFAVMMKARQYNRRILSPENQPNLLHFADLTDAAASLPDGSVKKFAEQFRNAELYGSLIEVTIPEGLEEEILCCEIPSGCRAQLNRMLKISRFLTQKYDVVCTNPPYMGSSGMHTDLLHFVKKQYPDSASDLSTCFMEKCAKLCRPDGFYALITIPVWMFLSSYQKLRETILRQHRYVSLIHLGRGVFGADFGASAFVISRQHIADYTGIYRRLFEKQGAVESIEQKETWFLQGAGYYPAKQENFSKIPGMPAAYWVSENVISCFLNSQKIGDVSHPRQGLATGDNEKFLRMWYEVSLPDIVFSASSISEFQESGAKYVPYNKGGSFRKWFANMEVVIRFDRQHYALLAASGNHLPSRAFYFRECITWSKVTSGSLSMRYIQKGSVFDVAGCSIFCEQELLYLLGFVNSCVMQHLMHVLSPSLNYEVGSVKAMPIRFAYTESVRQTVQENIRLSREDLQSFETHFAFEQHPLL